MANTRKIKVKLVKSLICCPDKLRVVVRALGLKKRNQVVEHFETPTIQGMINKVSHLIDVEVA